MRMEISAGLSLPYSDGVMNAPHPYTVLCHSAQLINRKINNAFLYVILSSRL
jgi:hypothetical protein